MFTPEVMDDQTSGIEHGGLDRRTLLRSAAALGAAAWVAGCGGTEGAAVRVAGGAPQAVQLGRWGQRARLTTARADAAVVAHRDHVHVLGGAARRVAATARHEAYDPSADRWRILAPLPEAVRAAGVASGRNRIYVAGGVDAAGRPLAAVHAFDLAEDAWFPLPFLPVAAAAPGLVVVEDLLVAVCGRHVCTLRLGDLGAAGWTEGARCPAPRSRPAVLALANVVHVIGGRKGRQPSDRHDVYNPWSDDWFEAAPLPTARHGAASADLGGQAVVAGGRGWDGLTRRTEAYDRRTDLWTSLAPLPVVRGGAGAAAVRGMLHVAGGVNRLGQRHDVFTRDA
jgi:N-acetylneuraminic acid mutarotase